MNTDIEQSATVIAERAPRAKPAVGLILGSGLGSLAQVVEDPVVISYADLPGFPKVGVAGHAGQLTLGEISGTAVAVMLGRAHYYETGAADVMKTPVRTLREIGCETLVVTNAAGSTDEATGPGSVMLITDTSPLRAPRPCLVKWATTALSISPRPMTPIISQRCALRPTALVSPWQKVFTCGSADRISKLRPRSAWRRLSVPAPSACRRCRR